MLTSQVQLVMPPHVNNSYRLFGGQLMAWIDIISSIAARRHTNTGVTTVCVDHLDFLGPAHLDDIVRIDARVTWTGRTSLEILAESYVEINNGEDRLINKAYLVFVALGDDDKKCTFPPFVPQTEKEKKEWTAAEARNKHRQMLRLQEKESQ